MNTRAFIAGRWCNTMQTDVQLFQDICEGSILGGVEDSSGWSNNEQRGAARLRAGAVTHRRAPINAATHRLRDDFRPNARSQRVAKPLAKRPYERFDFVRQSDVSCSHALEVGLQVET